MTSKVQHPKVVVKKFVHADCERVFDAWTKPELMQQWMIPGDGTAKTSNDFRVGGSYSHEMIKQQAASDCVGGTACADGTFSYMHEGIYEEINRPHRLVFTWNSPAVQNTRVTVELKAQDGGTAVTVTHELIDSDEQRQSHTSGWEGCLENLALFSKAAGK